MNIYEAIETIRPADRGAMEQAQKHWNDLAKPLGSLGLLEENIIRIAGMQGTPRVEIGKRGTLVMCADNGVVAEGVTQCGQDVTGIVAGNMTRHCTSLCHMSDVAHSEIWPVDIGMAEPVEGVRDEHVMRGTRNMAKEPAMSRTQCEQAIEVGIRLVQEKAQQGYQLLATGEMGIGNTTSSSAVAAVLLQQPVERMTGRGAGLSSQGLERKIGAIRQAIALHQPDAKDPVDVLAKVGGLDLAGLTGVFLGGAICHIPVLIDGFISAVAALCAVRMCPTASEYMIASHMSQEPASGLVMEALGLSPMIHARMRLGEGSGAVAAMPLLDMALAVYHGMSTFDETDIEAYQPLV
ncbi:MAG: nicotinate-nucleotide--dimethylbenzimidazole phosphoribosyltransferase [Eubacteriales bacterium]|jgi:nicotinate-nucleotide--dimethylbenzimidazole phosphoribosyltransferase